MKTSRYFEDTDTLYVQFSNNEIAETREFDQDVTVDVDRKGHIIALTIEHAKRVADVSDFSFQHVLPKEAI